MSGAMLKQAVRGLDEWMKQKGREINVDEIADIIAQHAITTAISAAASGVIPGVGGGIAFGIASASTITMYGRLAKAIGVRLDNGLIRALASAVAADLAAAIGAYIVAATVISFIPGAGTMGSAMLTGVANYGFVYLAGIIFIELAVTLGVSKMETMSEDELKTKAKKIRKGMDIKAVMKEAREIYKKEAASSVH